MIILYFQGDRILKCANAQSLASYIQSEDLAWWNDGYQVSIDNKPRFALHLYVAMYLPQIQSTPESN